MNAFALFAFMPKKRKLPCKLLESLLRVKRLYLPLVFFSRCQSIIIYTHISCHSVELQCWRPRKAAWGLRGQKSCRSRFTPSDLPCAFHWLWRLRSGDRKRLYLLYHSEIGIIWGCFCKELLVRCAADSSAGAPEASMFRVDS